MHDINLILRRPDLQDIRDRLAAYTGPPTERGCLPWLGNKNNKGYGLFRIDVRYAPLAHRVAYLLHHGKLPRYTDDGWYTCVCHECDNPECVNPAHFFLGSTVDNNKDRHRKGRSSGGALHGEQCSWSKLSDERVLQMLADRRLAKLVAVDYGVSESLVYQIRKGRRWKHLPRS